MLCGVCELYIELCAIPIIADSAGRHRSRSGRKEGKGDSRRSGDGAHGSSGTQQDQISWSKTPILLHTNI